MTFGGLGSGGAAYICQPPLRLRSRFSSFSGGDNVFDLALAFKPRRNITEVIGYPLVLL